MGADLYIKNLPREPQHTGFRTDVDLGYYRHAYNSSDVLWQFGLSWWTDVAKGLTTKDEEEGSIMTTDQAKKFLDILKSKEGVFKHNLELMLAKRNPVWDYKFKDNSMTEKEYCPADMTMKQRLDWVKEYKRDYKEFRKFLARAIELGSPIICSL